MPKQMFGGNQFKAETPASPQAKFFKQGKIARVFQQVVASASHLAALVANNLPE